MNKGGMDDLEVLS